MDHIKTIYDMLKKQYPDRITSCVRKDNLSPLFGLIGVPLDTKTYADVMKYARQQEADQMTPPYLLSDYLSYMYDGTVSQFARELGAPEQQVEQYMYDGCYWHGGALLRPVEIHDDSLAGFVSGHATFGKGKALRATFYPIYVMWAKSNETTPMPRVEFLRALSNELAGRGYPEVRSVRMGSKVGIGYKNISVKNI